MSTIEEKGKRLLAAARELHAANVALAVEIESAESEEDARRILSPVADEIHRAGARAADAMDWLHPAGQLVAGGGIVNATRALCAFKTEVEQIDADKARAAS